MRFTFTPTEDSRLDVREALFLAMDLGLPSIVTIESLLDRAERSEWGGLW